MGKTFAELRVDAGFPLQQDLATAIKVKQQTVSRWEKGASRPRGKDLPMLAKALRVPASDLQVLFGERQPPAQPEESTSFDSPFPLGTLNPRAFERFCAMFLQAHYGEGYEVHLHGSTGHDQRGIDISVKTPAGENFEYQCKRAAKFGPGQIAAIVNKYHGKADRVFILLSRTASGRARDAVRAHERWGIWDLEDISLKLRQLRPAQLSPILDTFFPGRKLALIGRDEDLHWLSPQDYFKPWLQPDKRFNHAWPLIGRNVEQDAITAALLSPSAVAVIVAGNAGIGKTRLIRHVLESQPIRESFQHIYLLAERRDAGEVKLSALGEGKKLIVVDDAHDSDDLVAIGRYVASSEDGSRVLFVTRTHGLAKVQHSLWKFAIIDERLRIVHVDALPRTSARALAVNALEAFGADAGLADALAAASENCTLALVAGAFSVAHDGIYPSRLPSHRAFRELVLQRYADVASIDPARPVESAQTRQVLQCLALIQPVSDARDISNLLGNDGLSTTLQIHQTLKRYVDTGLILQRKGRLRIVPDLVADQLVNDACFAVGGKSTGFAEQLLDKAPPHLINNIITNVSKTYWLRDSSAKSDNCLLDLLWEKAKERCVTYERNTHTLQRLAYFEPARALAFADDCIRTGKIVDSLEQVVFSAAHHFEHVDHAIETLWVLAQREQMNGNQTRSGALSKLVELVSVAPNKPTVFCAKVTDRMLSLLDRDSAWTKGLCPYDALAGSLRADGLDTEWQGKSFSLRHFAVQHAAVANIRRRVIDRAILQLDDEDLSRAWRAAVFLEEAFRPPMIGATSPSELDKKEAWQDEFVSTLKKVRRCLSKYKHDNLIVFRVAKSVAYLAKYSKSEVQTAARAVLATQPNDLEYRITLALIDGFGHLYDDADHARRRAEWSVVLTETADDAIKQHSDIAGLHTKICTVLKSHQEVSGFDSLSARPFLYELCVRSPAYRDCLLTGTADTSRTYVAVGLHALAQCDISVAIAQATRLVEVGDDVITHEVANALGSLFQRATQSQIEDSVIPLLLELVESKNEDIAVAAADSIRALSARFPEVAQQLLITIDFTKSTKVANEVLTQLCTIKSPPLATLTSESLAPVFHRLSTLSKTGGFGVAEFMSSVSRSHPHEVVRVLTTSIERQFDGNEMRHYATLVDDFHPVKFREAVGYLQVRDELWRWAKQFAMHGGAQLYVATDLLAATLSPFDGEYFSFLLQVAEEDAAGATLACSAYCRAGYKPILERTTDVERFLEVGSRFGEVVARTIESELYCAGAYGQRQGTYGEPFPRDIETVQKVKGILSTLDRFSRAWNLYERIKKNSQREIDERTDSDDEDD
ncbi:MAG: helix-turn-helix domain-containing protein [Burkholderiales bacterium]|nr:helix-turn-helix domain-containing protein [Burkholderiales bacterium]